MPTKTSYAFWSVCPHCNRAFAAINKISALRKVRRHMRVHVGVEGCYTQLLGTMRAFGFAAGPVPDPVSESRWLAAQLTCAGLTAPHPEQWPGPWDFAKVGPWDFYERSDGERELEPDEKRQPGYYWIRLCNDPEWRIAEWHEGEGAWFLTEDSNFPHYDEELHETEEGPEVLGDVKEVRQRLRPKAATAPPHNYG